MKRPKFFASIATLIFMTGFGFVSCSNNDDENIEEAGITDTDNTEEALESAAFNLLRSVCNLDADEDDIEELSENWKSASYTIDEGSVIGDDENTVYSIPCYDIDDALEFFSDIIGSPVS